MTKKFLIKMINWLESEMGYQLFKQKNKISWNLCTHLTNYAPHINHSQFEMRFKSKTLEDIGRDVKFIKKELNSRLFALLTKKMTISGNFKEVCITNVITNLL